MPEGNVGQKKSLSTGEGQPLGQLLYFASEGAAAKRFFS